MRILKLGAAAILAVMGASCSAPAPTTGGSTAPASTMPASMPPASMRPASAAPASSTPASMTPASTTPASASPAAATLVTVKDFTFTPATVTIRVGQTVTWRFEDAVAHTATSDTGSAETFDSGLLATGQSFSHTFSQAGSFPYHCTPHPNMKGTIIVQ